MRNLSRFYPYDFFCRKEGSKRRISAVPSDLRRREDATKAEEGLKGEAGKMVKIQIPARAHASISIALFAAFSPETRKVWKTKEEKEEEEEETKEASHNIVFPRKTWKALCEITKTLEGTT